MFEVFNRAKGHKADVWAATDGSRVLALLIPVRVTLLGGIMSSLTTRSVAYGSILCAPGRDGCDALAVLLQSYLKEVGRTALFTELRNVSSLDAQQQQTLLEHGFVHEDHLNYLIDLNRPSDEVFKSIGPRTRKHIRRALRSGQVTVSDATENPERSSCYDILRRTFQARRIPLADPSLFEAAYEVLHPRGMIKFTLARVGDAPAAVSIDLLYKDLMYGWYGGVDRAYSSFPANELLTWHILRWGAENGYRTYDFGGAGKPNEPYGVRDFKSKFGGIQVNNGRNLFVHARLRRQMCNFAYRFARRFVF